MYVRTYVCMYVCMYVFIFICFLLFIYLQHARLHRVILHAYRKLYDIYTVFTFLRIGLHAVYVRTFRLPFRSHCGPGVDPAPNRNEYQEHFLGAKAAGV